jgi:hypothetical protein
MEYEMVKGGSFVALRSPKDGDRLDIPAGARVERTEGRQDAQARPRLWPVGRARLVIIVQIIHFHAQKLRYLLKRPDGRLIVFIVNQTPHGRRGDISSP